MFKFIITGLIVYFIYRMMIVPPPIDQGPDNIKIKKENKKRSAEEDDYIDYEEVE